jgi:GNAT superfamily N-acetyltransferase
VIQPATHRLRDAARADANALARLRCASLVELGLVAPGDVPSFERAARAEFAARLAEDCLAAKLLICEGEVAGSASVIFWRRLPYAETSLHAELAGVYVVPRFRMRGFAQALCRAALDAARQRGVRRIVVHPSEAGRELYRRLGFSESNQMHL